MSLFLSPSDSPEPPPDFGHLRVPHSPKYSPRRQRTLSPKTPLHQYSPPGEYSPHSPPYPPPVSIPINYDSLYAPVYNVNLQSFVWLSSWVMVTHNIERVRENFEDWAERVFKKTLDILYDTVYQFTPRLHVRETLEILCKYVPPRQLTFMRLAGTDTIVEVFNIFKKLRASKSFSLKELITMKEYFLKTFLRTDSIYYDHFANIVISIILVNTDKTIELADEIIKLLVDLRKSTELEPEATEWYDNIRQKVESLQEVLKIENPKVYINELFRCLVTVLSKQKANSNVIETVANLFVDLNMKSSDIRNQEMNIIVRYAPHKVAQQYIENMMKDPNADIGSIVKIIIDYQRSGQEPFALLEWIGEKQYFNMRNGELKGDGGYVFTPFEYAIDTGKIDAVDFFQRKYGIKMYRYAWNLAKRAGIDKEITLLRRSYSGKESFL